MPFNQKPQKFNANINTVEIGCGDKAIKLGGECTFPFYTFDAPTENAPKVGVEISDLGLARRTWNPGILCRCYHNRPRSLKRRKQWKVRTSFAYVWKAETRTAADKSIDELIAVVKEVGEAVSCPLVVEGCKNVEKDSELLPESSRSSSGQKRFSPFCKRRRLQSCRCSSRPCLQPEGWSRIRC